MSVDPDDRTPLAIRNAADEVITYGAPVLPGAMFMLAYAGKVPIMDVPGCVMYDKTDDIRSDTAENCGGERLKAEDFTALGEGGLCLNCPVCTFPKLQFRKIGRKINHKRNERKIFGGSKMRTGIQEELELYMSKSVAQASKQRDFMKRCFCLCRNWRQERRADREKSFITFRQSF